MSDELARVVGAGNTVTVRDKTFTLSPLGMPALQEMQRAAIRDYKDSYLESYFEGIQRLPNWEDRYANEVQRIAGWDVDDLPRKTVYGVLQVPMTDKMKTWLEEHFGDKPSNDMVARRLLATALDCEDIKQDQVFQLTGKRPMKSRVPYDGWWATAKEEGMVIFLHMSLKEKHPKLQLSAVRGWPLPKLIEASRMLEEITAPMLKNMSGAQPSNGRQKRRGKRK